MPRATPQPSAHPLGTLLRTALAWLQAPGGAAWRRACAAKGGAGCCSWAAGLRELNKQGVVQCGARAGLRRGRWCGGACHRHIARLNQPCHLPHVLSGVAAAALGGGAAPSLAGSCRHVGDRGPPVSRADTGGLQRWHGVSEEAARVLVRADRDHPAQGRAEGRGSRATDHLRALW